MGNAPLIVAVLEETIKLLEFTTVTRLQRFLL
jgi:hypothetical protein